MTQCKEKDIVEYGGKTLLCSSLDHCYSLRVASGIYIELSPFVVSVKKKKKKKKICTSISMQINHLIFKK